MDHTRRETLRLAVVGSVGLLVPGLSTAQTPTPPQRPPNKPALMPDVVKEFVKAGHGKFDHVKELLGNEPGLLNASWDVGGGDFESALEAAGHIGDREIALYLIGKGARLSIFQVAILGQLDLVKGIIALYPEARQSKGPHGLDLIHHAKKGGAQAEAVLEYLQRHPMRE
jgi:hypothetical protein